MEPRTIAHGERAMVDIDLQAHEIWRQVVRGLITDCRAKSLKKVRIEIYPTIGSAVQVEPDQYVLDYLGAIFEEEKRALQAEGKWPRTWGKIRGSIDKFLKNS